jgi:subtilisin family serine protease
MRQLKLVAAMVAGGLSLGACSDAPQPTASVGATPSLAVSGEASQKIADRHVFTMHGGRTANEIAAEVTAAGGTIRYSMDAIGVVLTSGLSDAAAARIASGKATVANDLGARWVPSITLMATQSIPVDALAPLEGASLLPPQSAAFKAFQWNMRITDTDDSWNQGFTGRPSVRVAILDTGLDAYHLDQMGLIDVASSIAFVPSKTGPPAWEDDHFHGTHVGGIVTSNNFGVAGVAPNVTLVAVKVLDEHGNGSLGDVIAGLYYAADIGVDVINMSLGATFPKNEAQGIVPAFNRAVNYAHSKGVFIAAASGNDGEDLQHNSNRVAVPCETGVLSCISATASNDRPAYYTNYGTNAINNAAPGGDFSQGLGSPAGGILSLCSSHSTDPFLAGCKPQDTPFGMVGTNYVFAEGTSMASPHIAGLGALLDSQYAGALNGSQILTAIQQNADDLGKPGADAFYGKGRMNTCRTLPGCVPVANP